jgi:branched-subunit amino acid transport protein
VGLAGVLPFVPFGLVTGVALASSTLPEQAGWGTSPLIDGGTAQLLLARLFDEGAAPLLVVVAALDAQLPRASAPRALRVAGPAALAVLVVPAVVPPTSTLDPIAAAPRLVAAAAAVVVYRRRRSVGLTVGTGLLVLGAADVVLST